MNEPNISKVLEHATYTRSLLSTPATSPAKCTTTISTLNLQQHPEGGYYVETDRDPLLIPNPFTSLPPLANASSNTTINGDPNKRNAMTSIHYFLDLASPVGHFHRNRARTVHTLHWGRGCYVLLYPPGVDDGEWKMESFVVGSDIGSGERVQWIVDGGIFKASFLLEDHEGKSSEAGLLISETVVPGFEFCDHDFLTADGLKEASAEKLEWLLVKNEREKY